MIDRAFIDESIRMSADGYVYVFAAVSPTLRTGSLVPLRRVLLPGQRYVHWRDETNERRATFVDAINTMAFEVTVAVMEPVNVLALSVPPLPEKSLADEVPMVNLERPSAVWNGSALMAASVDVVRFAVDVDFWLAVTFSRICMVTVSPTRRARRSSNAGR